MSDKKRKAKTTLDSRPAKRQHATETAVVEIVNNTDGLRPVIAISAGPSFPREARFQSYTKKTADGSDLLLHSSSHPTIDYTAAEGTEHGDKYAKHYLAVMDTTSNMIKTTEATNLTVRGSVRQEETLEDNDDAETANFMASQNTRSALTQAFGSKKSKKAVASTAENRQLGQGVEGATIAEVITANVMEKDKESVEKTIVARSTKPLPVADISTDDIERVYSLSKLVVPPPAARTLQQMPIDAWKAKLRAESEVKTSSRFVANRLTYVGKRAIQDDSPKFNQQLQILRYIQLLIEVARYAGKQDRRRRLPFIDDWPEGTLSPGIASSTVKSAVRHFFPDNTPSERLMTLLRTTIFALTLHIVPPSGKAGDGRLVVEPTDVQLDLALEAAEVRKLYHELGCKMVPAADKDLIAWGYDRVVAQQKKQKAKDKDKGIKAPKLTFAVLKFPLDFPKASTGKRRS